MRALLLASLLSTSTLSVHTHALGRQDSRVQLELAGVLELGGGAATLLVLRTRESKTILPMLLPGVAGKALAADLQAHRTPGLAGVTLRALGARVQEVELRGSEDEVRTGCARVAQGRKVVEVRGGPLDLVSLAVATGAPIFIDRRLFEAAGLTPEDIDRARHRLEDHEHQSWL